MRFLLEVVADDAEDAVPLIREAATRLKRGKVKHGEIVNACIGDWRMQIQEEAERVQTLPEEEIPPLDEKPTVQEPKEPGVK